MIFHLPLTVRFERNNSTAEKRETMEFNKIVNLKMKIIHIAHQARRAGGPEDNGRPKWDLYKKTDPVFWTAFKANRRKRTRLINNEEEKKSTMMTFQKNSKPRK